MTAIRQSIVLVALFSSFIFSAPAFGQSDNLAFKAGLTPVQSVRLSTDENGVLESFSIQPGDEISAGQVIAVLKQKQFEAKRSAAANELSIATNEAQNDIDLRYAQTLQQVNEKTLAKSEAANQRYPNTISVTELDRLRLEAERASLSAEQAIAKREQNDMTVKLKQDLLKLATLQLENRTLRSPISGTVVEVLFHEGEFLGAGQPLARVINLDQLKANCQANIKDIMPNEVAPEALFRVEVDGQDVDFPAQISFVSPEINWARKTFLVTAKIENSKRQLYSGQFGQLILQKK